MKIHIVQKGDTLWKIAKKYGVDFEQLKGMNTQLSNPDLIMPGMKIKVPSGNVAVKKEAPIKKEMPKAEHPFAKEKPKEVLGVEDTAPKEPITEKPSKPYIPPVPNVQHPVYTGVDMNNYYTVNMAMMPQMANPQLPPKPENVLPDITKDVEDMYKVPAKDKEQPFYESPQQEEATKDMANMPDISNVANMQMPGVSPAMHQPQYLAPQHMVPVSPVLPGYGFCPPMHYQPMVMPYGYGPAMPNQPYPSAVSPAEYDDDDDDEYGAHSSNMPYPQAVAPAHYGPGFPVNPYAGVPVSPVLPGYGFNPNQVLGAYGEAPDDDDFDYDNHSPNMPYPQAVAPAYTQNDCGCGGKAEPYVNPYQGYPMQQQQPFDGYPMQQQPFGGYPMQQQPFGGYPMQQQPFGGYPMQQQPFGGYPMQQQPFSGYQTQQPFMAPQGYNPGQMQMAPSGQMFDMPNYDDDREEDED